MTITLNQIIARRRADAAARKAHDAVVRAEQAVSHAAPDAVGLADRALVLLQQAEHARMAAEGGDNLGDRQ